MKKNTLKSLFCLCLAVTMVLTGCSKASEETPSGDQKVEENVEQKATNTPVPTSTDTPVPTATNTPVPTATNTPIPTNTPTPSIILATENKMIEDANNKSAADLADEWTISKYQDGWVSTSASIGVGRSYDGSNAVNLVYWDNWNTFKYSKKYNVTEGYNAISFDVKGNGISDIKLQLLNSVTGVYATINLSNNKKTFTDWTNVVIPIDDANMKMTTGGQEMRLDEAILTIGMTDINEVIRNFDTISFIVYGVTDNGAKANTYIDNLQFIYEKDVKIEVTPIIYEKGIMVDNFESYSETGVGYDQNNAEASISGLRAEYYSDYYTEGSKSPMGGNNWALMGSTDYLQLAKIGYGSNQSLKLKANSNTLRFTTWDLYTGDAKSLGRGNHVSFWVKGGEYDVTLKIRVIYENQITASTQTTVEKEEKSFVIPAGSDWTEYKITTFPSKDIYGFVFLPRASKTSYFYIDNISIQD